MCGCCGRCWRVGRLLLAGRPQASHGLRALQGGTIRYECKALVETMVAPAGLRMQQPPNGQYSRVDATNFGIADAASAKQMGKGQPIFRDTPGNAYISQEEGGYLQTEQPRRGVAQSFARPYYPIKVLRIASNLRSTLLG